MVRPLFSLLVPKQTFHMALYESSRKKQAMRVFVLAVLVSGCFAIPVAEKPVGLIFFCFCFLVANVCLQVRRIEEETQAQQMQEKIKHQLEIIKMKTGSTDMKSQSVKNLVQDQLLLVLNNDATDPGKFKNFLPLVNQVIVYTGAVLPGIKASKQHKQVHELSEGMLVQTIAEAAGSPPTQSSLSDLEKYLPTSADMLDAMTKIGKVMGGNGGFNPIQMMTNIVSENDMKAAIDEVMHFPLRFPDLTESQLAVAEEVVLSVGLGFTNQEQAMETFLAAMNDEQRRMITSLQKVNFCVVWHVVVVVVVGVFILF